MKMILMLCAAVLVTGCNPPTTKAHAEPQVEKVQLMTLTDEQFAKELHAAMHETPASVVGLMAMGESNYNDLVIGETAMDAWYTGSKAGGAFRGCLPVSKTDAISAVTASLVTEYEPAPLTDAATKVFQKFYCHST